MKQVKCSNPDCSSRRAHWTKPYANRPHQMVEVLDDHEGPMYCSIECWSYHKNCNVFTGEKIKDGDQK